MYTSDLRKKLNVPTPPLAAPKLQLHRGFWSAYLAVDKQLMQEVNKQLKLVKVRSTEAWSVWCCCRSGCGVGCSSTAVVPVHFMRRQHKLA